MPRMGYPQFDFSQEYSTAPLATAWPLQLARVFIKLLSWCRGVGTDVTAEWIRDPNSDDPGKGYEWSLEAWGIGATVVPFWYRAAEWYLVSLHEYWGTIIQRYGYTPVQIFGGDALTYIPFARQDSIFFPVLNFVLLDVVKAWLENTDRITAAAFSEKNETTWQVDIAWTADASSRWPTSRSLHLETPYTPTLIPVGGPLPLLGSHYEAEFADVDGETLPVRFNTENAIYARLVANSIASKSDARWMGLNRITELGIPKVDGNGDPLFAMFAEPPASTSDVQRKGRAVYRTANPDDRITVEIPSVKDTLVGRGNYESSSDPLPVDTIGLLLTENGAPATALRQVRFGNRNRKATE